MPWTRPRQSIDATVADHGRGQPAHRRVHDGPWARPCHGIETGHGRELMDRGHPSLRRSPPGTRPSGTAWCLRTQRNPLPTNWHGAGDRIVDGPLESLVRRAPSTAAVGARRSVITRGPARIHFDLHGPRPMTTPFHAATWAAALTLATGSRLGERALPRHRHRSRRPEPASGRRRPVRATVYVPLAAMSAATMMACGGGRIDQSWPPGPADAGSVFDGSADASPPPAGRRQARVAATETEGRVARAPPSSTLWAGVGPSSPPASHEATRTSVPMTRFITAVRAW